MDNDTMSMYLPDNKQESMQQGYFRSGAQTAVSPTAQTMSGSNPVTEYSNVLGDKGTGSKSLMQHLDTVINAQKPTTPETPQSPQNNNPNMEKFWNAFSASVDNPWKSMADVHKGTALIGAATQLMGGEEGFRSSVYGHQVTDETKQLMSQNALLGTAGKIESGMSRFEGMQAQKSADFAERMALNEEKLQTQRDLATQKENMQAEAAWFKSGITQQRDTQVEIDKARSDYEKALKDNKLSPEDPEAIPHAEAYLKKIKALGSSDPAMEKWLANHKVRNGGASSFIQSLIQAAGE